MGGGGEAGRKPNHRPPLLSFLQSRDSSQATTGADDHSTTPQQQQQPHREGLSVTLARTLAAIAVANLNIEYPNSLALTLFSDADVQAPRALHPAFFGCYDWHSSVHTHWQLGLVHSSHSLLFSLLPSYFFSLQFAQFVWCASSRASPSSPQSGRCWTTT